METIRPQENLPEHLNIDSEDRGPFGPDSAQVLGNLVEEPEDAN